MGKISMITGLLLLVLCGTLQGQTMTHPEEADQITYELYAQHHWKPLLEKGQQALEEGFDFYYLRVRMGIACYYLGRYELAREHLQKALQFQRKEPFATEYLYYANRYTGRYGEARRLLKDLPLTKRKEMHAADEYSLAAVTMESGWLENTSVDQLIADLPVGDFVSSYFMKNLWYLNLGLSANLGYQSTAHVSFNRFNTNFYQGVFVTDSLYAFDHTGKQNGIYLSYRYHFPQALYAGLNYHAIRGSADVSYFLENGTGEYDFVRITEPYAQSYFGGYVGKHLKNFNLSVQLSRNAFWNGSWLQSGVRAYWYPTGNLKYYVGGGYDLMYQNDRSMETAYQLVAGFNVLRYFQVEASHIAGDLGNWTDANGYYIFNTLYPIRSRTGVGLLIHSLLPNFSIHLSAYKQQRDHFANLYFEDGTVETVPQTFQSISFFGGLSWQF